VSDRQASEASTRGPGPWTAAAILAAVAWFGCGDGGETILHIFSWSDYFTTEIIKEFEQEKNVRVVLDTYENNEGLVAKLQTGVTGYDLVVPSDYAVEQLIGMGLLLAIDRDNVPNFAGLDPKFLGQYFDPTNTYSVPYLWGTAGIGYDSSQVDPAPTSWAVLWDDEYADRMNMLDDMREAFGVALKRLDYSVNTSDRGELDEARALLIEQKPLLRSYATETDDLMLTGQVVLTHAWSGDVVRVAEEKPEWRYALPIEGSTFFIDNLAIPKGAANKAAAEAFIDFILRPKNIAAVTAFTRYGNCVPASSAHLPKALRDNPAVFPPSDAYDRLEPIRYSGDMAVMYGQAWTAVKAAQ